MKLSELLSIVDFDFDFCDYDWDTCFYAAPTECNKYAEQIDVKRLDKYVCVCDFSKFINENKELIIDKIRETYKYPNIYIEAIDNPNYYDWEYCDIINTVIRDLLEGE